MKAPRIDSENILAALAITFAACITLVVVEGTVMLNMSLIKQLTQPQPPAHQAR